MQLLIPNTLHTCYWIQHQDLCKSAEVMKQPMSNCDIKGSMIWMTEGLHFNCVSILMSCLPRINLWWLISPPGRHIRKTLVIYHLVVYLLHQWCKLQTTKDTKPLLAYSVTVTQTVCVNGVEVSHRMALIGLYVHLTIYSFITRANKRKVNNITPYFWVSFGLF